jgi:hypothetical protein
MNFISKNLIAKSLGPQPAPSGARVMGGVVNGTKYGRGASPIRLSHAQRAIHDSDDDNEGDFEEKTHRTFVHDHISPCTPTSQARKDKVTSSSSGVGDVGGSERVDREREDEYETEKRREESVVLKALDVSDRELLLCSTSGSEL